jgi:hypothetical protein
LALFPKEKPLYHNKDLKETGAATAMQHKDVNQSRTTGQSGLRIRISARSDRETDPQLKLMWGDHWVKQELVKGFFEAGSTVTDQEPDVILHLFGGPPKKRFSSQTQNLVWLYSHPDLVTKENLRGYDHIFCASEDFIPKLRAMGYSLITYLPACTSKTPVNVMLKYNVIFLGNARTSRSDGRAVVDAVKKTGADFKVWGNLWDTLLPASNVGGRYWPYENIQDLYASARITINDHHPDMAREGFVSNKVFDILASGGFVISDKNPGLDRIFDGCVPQFESTEELKELLARFQNDSDERTALMERGREVALSHTYSYRIQTFLQEMDSFG